MTEPQFWVSSGPSACGACAAAATGGAQNGLVQVEAQGEAGIYDWTALSSTGSGALMDWLTANQFVVPAGAQSILDSYISQGMHFLAVRVREPQGLAAGILKDAPPIQFNVAMTRRFYAMSISQISAAAQTEVVLYVLAGHRAEAANVPNAMINSADVTYDARSESKTNYEQLFSDAIAGNGGLAFVTEFAAPCIIPTGTVGYAPLWPMSFPASMWPSAPAVMLDKNLYLTRLRSLIPRERMGFDLDLQDAAVDTGVSMSVYLNPVAAASLGALAAPLPLVLSFGVGAALMRRSYRRRVGRG